MSGKKIVIKIHEDGKINAETFGMVGTECALELDKLMKDLARTVTRTKKTEYFKEKISSDNKVKVNKND
jgi:hypothetical protein